MAAAGSKPGFFAPDIQTLLQQRAAWLEGLGDAVILDSDTLDSGSEQWDGETKDRDAAAGEEDTSEKPTQKASALPGSLCDLLAAGFARVDVEDLDVAAARERFRAAARQEGVLTLRGSCSGGQNQHLQGCIVSREKWPPYVIGLLGAPFMSSNLIGTMPSPRLLGFYGPLDTKVAETSDTGATDRQLQDLRREVGKMGDHLKAQATQDSSFATNPSGDSSSNGCMYQGSYG
eukprot:symbB.v1.2.003717.t1/scaffold209.1/size267950/15